MLHVAYIRIGLIPLAAHASVWPCTL
jgi:hypothetical protein